MRGTKAKYLRKQAQLLHAQGRGAKQRKNNPRQVLTSQVRHTYQFLKGVL